MKCNTSISLTSEVGKTKISLQESDEYIAINCNLSILAGSLDQMKLMSQLAYQARVMTI